MFHLQSQGSLADDHPIAISTVFDPNARFPSVTPISLTLQHKIILFSFLRFSLDSVQYLAARYANVNGIGIPWFAV
jgi:hypothetical protein